MEQSTWKDEIFLKIEKLNLFIFDEMFKQLLEKRELFIQYSGKKFKSFFTRFQGSESDSTDIYQVCFWVTSVTLISFLTSSSL